MNTFKACALFLVLIILTGCSSGYEISENLKKTIKQQSIEQISIQVNEQEKNYSVKDIRISEQFLSVDNSVYNLSAVKTYTYAGNKIIVIM